MTWDDIAFKHATDKARVHRTTATQGHGYMDIYERMLSSARIGSVLELGIDQGASLRTWCDIWPDAQIIGVDRLDREYEVDRAIVRLGDAADAQFVDAIGRQYGPFDVIVDDASHDPKQVIVSFRALFGHLRHGGWYFIEDLYWPQVMATLPELTHQAVKEFRIIPDAIAANRNVLGVMLIAVQHQGED